VTSLLPGTSNNSRTLEQLEDIACPEPLDSDTYLVRECHRLRKIPLGHLTTEQLRMLILQKIGPTYLVPIALAKLEMDPFVAGDSYPGDLLHAVVNLSADFWEGQSELLSRLDQIIGDLKSKRNLLEQDILPAWRRLYGR
jgi:CDI immunity proteins